MRVSPLCCVAAALFAAGCGGETGVAVSGTVTRGGEPLSSATVTFEPKPNSGTTGTGEWADVQDGQFLFPEDKLLMPGTYVVRVVPIAPGSGADLKTAPPQFPLWETTVELKAESTPFQFDLPGNPKKR
jgi:hypothetical protein